MIYGRFDNVADVNQIACPIRVGENIKHIGHLAVGIPGAHGGEQPSPAELGFAEARCPVDAVVFQKFETVPHRRKSPLQASRRHQVQIVQGGMILRVLAVFGTHDRHHREVDPRAAVLALVTAAVQEGVPDEVRMLVPQDVQGGPVGQGRTASRGKEGIGPVVADAGQVEPGHDVLLHSVQIPAQIGQGADRLGEEDDAVGEPARPAHDPPGQHGCHHRPRQLIVGHGRVADIR